MEHRLSARMPVALDVVIYDRGLPATRGKTRDLSLRGMFVEAPGALRKHRRIEVEFCVGPWQSSKSYRVAAVVVQSSAKGMGLEFENADAEAYQAIRYLLKEQQRAHTVR